MSRAKSDKNGLEPLEVAPLGLAQTFADEPEVVRWVARNISVRRPNPAECPDPFAWTLLRMCREDPSFTTWFVDKLWSKLIPSRSQLDTKQVNDIDGRVTVELIERIQATRDKANEKAAKVAGQEKKPARDYFAEIGIPEEGSK